MLTKLTLQALVTEYSQTAEHQQGSLHALVEALLVRFTKQGKVARGGLVYSREYFVVTFVLLRSLQFKLQHGAELVRVPEWQLEQLRRLLIGVLRTDRLSAKQRLGTFRVGGGVTPDVLASYRRMLGDVAQRCMRAMDEAHLLTHAPLVN